MSKGVLTLIAAAVVVIAAALVYMAWDSHQASLKAQEQRDAAMMQAREPRAGESASFIDKVLRHYRR